jgi:hypothetical protein
MKKQVKILYSPGYGAGWYTTNTQYPDCLRDSEIIELVEQMDKLLEEVEYDSRDIEKYEYYSITKNLPKYSEYLLTDEFLSFRELYNNIVQEIERLANEKWPKGYWSTGTIRQLTIAVMNEGQIFKLNDFDGSESIEYVYTDSHLLIA